MTRVREGSPHAHGAIWDGKGTNFASLFRACHQGGGLPVRRREEELERIELPEYTNQIWHGYIQDVHPGRLWFRVHGPYEPEAGPSLQSQQAAARSVCARRTLASSNGIPHLRLHDGAEGDDLTFDERDSAPFMPKCTVVDPNFDWKGQPRVARRSSWDDTIIYETHVKGFTKLHPQVPEQLRGTYAGFDEGSRRLHQVAGRDLVELLPIHTFINDSHLLEKGLTNYWGYNSIGFFAPDPRYASEPEQTLREFKEMVARFHDAGLEVILDVVYNHTAEGNERGPTLSFKGIDNASYYRLLPDQKRYYINDTGTGNT